MMQFQPATERLTPARYFRNIYDALRTALVGMSITIRYFFTKPVTVQYPEEMMPVAERYRGLHYLEQDICIACRVCERACPVDCIVIRFERKPGNVNEWFEFSLDYNKCIFCELCCYPCPVDCIHMTREHSLVAYNRSQFVVDLLSWKDMRKEDEEVMEKAAEEKAKKAAEAAARKAASAGQAKAPEKKPAGKAAEAEEKGTQKKAAEKPEKKAPEKPEEAGGP